MKRRPSRRWRPVAPTLQGLENRLLLTSAPDLALSLGDATFAYDPVVPGDKGTVTVFLENVGNLAATGSINIEVRGSTDTIFDSSDLLLGSKLRLKGSLAPGDDQNITIKLVVPATATPGNYYMVVQVTSTLSVADPNAANDVAASPDSGQIIWAFGNVGTRTNVKLKVNDGTGLVSFALSGPGTGVVVPASGAGINFDSVDLTGTQYASKLKISTTGKNLTKISDIAVSNSAGVGTGSIKSIDAKNVDLENYVLVSGLISKLTLHDISSVIHNIWLNNGGVAAPEGVSVSITANAILGCTIDTGGIPIKSFKLAQADGVSVTTPWIGSLTVKSKILGEGNFTNGTLTLNGPNGNNGVALAKLQVFNALDGTVINATSDVKSVSAYKWLGGSLTSDDLGKVTIKGDMDADITTDGFTSAKISGDCGGTWNAMRVGKLQVDGDLLDLTLDMLSLDKLTVKGWMDSSKVLADNGIGMVTLGGMRDSNLFAGVDSVGLPAASTDFDTANLGTIETVLVKGLKDGTGQWIDSFINSNIAAWTLGKVTLANMQPDNSGTLFGITTHELDKYLLMHDGSMDTNGDWIGSSNPLEAIVVHGTGDYRVTIVGGP